MTDLSLSVSRCQDRSLSRYLCRSVAWCQGKCVLQYTRKYQENIAHPGMRTTDMLDTID